MNQKANSSSTAFLVQGLLPQIEDLSILEEMHNHLHVNSIHLLLGLNHGLLDLIIPSSPPLRTLDNSIHPVGGTFTLFDFGHILIFFFFKSPI